MYHHAPSKMDSSRHLVAWIWKPCPATMQLTIISCVSYKKCITNVSPNHWLFQAWKMPFSALFEKNMHIIVKNLDTMEVICFKSEQG